MSLAWSPSVKVEIEGCGEAAWLDKARWFEARLSGFLMKIQAQGFGFHKGQRPIESVFRKSEAFNVKFQGFCVEGQNAQLYLRMLLVYLSSSSKSPWVAAKECKKNPPLIWSLTL